MTTIAESRTVTIRPSAGWRALDLKELAAYRDLFLFLVWRDIKVLYSQTALGFSWALIRPIFQTLVFTLVFGRMAGMRTDGAPYALFSLSALIPWTYFASAASASTQSLVNATTVITKVYFPRLLIPAAGVVAKLVDFAVSLPLVVPLLIKFHVVPTANVVFLPLLIVIMIATAAGVGLWLSALAVQYRDVKHASEFLLQLLMFVAPVVWPVSLIDTHFGHGARVLYGLYPMAGVIEGFRAALLGTTRMPWDLIAGGAASAAVLFVTGALFFRRMESRFADVA